MFSPYYIQKSRTTPGATESCNIHVSPLLVKHAAGKAVETFSRIRPVGKGFGQAPMENKSAVFLYSFYEPIMIFFRIFFVFIVAFKITMVILYITIILCRIWKQQKKGIRK